MSWFKYVETEEEFQISYLELKQFLTNSTTIIGNLCSANIESLLTKLLSKSSNLFHYHFLNTTTFDFLGDSITEAANTSIKSGAYGVSSKMTITNSGFIK